MLRPNQYVRARVKGATRPNAILVPQRAVLQGAKGHFVWVVDKDGKAENRPVIVGDWSGDDWVVTEGLRAGDRVVVDGGLKLGPGTALNPKAYAGTAAAPRIPGEAAAAARAEARDAEGGGVGVEVTGRARVLEVLHRAADLRDRRRDAAHARRRGVADRPAGPAVSRTSRRCR